ncbi:MAG TPA: DUF1015 domain-containing protein [Candidatus Limnocylindrales bacterium]|nr:DUF1015 domain-containing protein [Candidatus Limnocylindrales bacterium]
MATIRPFKGIRYNQPRVGDLGKVITPPYDVINPREQECLYQESPYNFIRLEYGLTYPTDNETENRYSRAAQTFQNWLSEEILQPENENMYYLYEQTYTCHNNHFRRRGIITALKLEPYTNKVVLPHEVTMAAPKADRLAMLRCCRTNFSPILALFPDPEQRAAVFFAGVTEAKPLIDILEANGQAHRIWAISDPALQQALTAYLKTQPLLIADGHHRYETALHFAQSADAASVPGSGYVLATLVSLNDPGLLILPTHRLLAGLSLSQKEKLMQIVKSSFNLTACGAPSGLDLDGYTAKLEKGSLKTGIIGFINNEQAYLITPKTAPDVNTLSVSLLQDRLLTPFLENENDIAGKNTISYCHDAAEALESVITGISDAVFILNAIPVADTMDRALQGKIMPQKSTYFYPKLPSGLVLYHMTLSY